MKRKLFFGLAGLAFVAAAAITTISTINTNTHDSDLLTKNLEALTKNESGNNGFTETGGYCTKCGASVDVCVWCSAEGCNCDVGQHNC